MPSKSLSSNPSHPNPQPPNPSHLSRPLCQSLHHPKKNHVHPLLHHHACQRHHPFNPTFSLTPIHQAPHLRQVHIHLPYLLLPTSSFSSLSPPPPSPPLPSNVQQQSEQPAPPPHLRPPPPPPPPPGNRGPKKKKKKKKK